MKTLEQIDSMIEDTLFMITPTESFKKPRKKDLEELRFLRSVKAYLQSLPRKEFLEQELAKKENLLKLHAVYFNEHFPKGTKKQKLEYDKKNDLPKIKEQIKTLKFLLNQ